MAKILLNEITIERKNCVAIRNLKNNLYKEKINGFYVHAKPEITSAKQVTQYV